MALAPHTPPDWLLHARPPLPMALLCDPVAVAAQRDADAALRRLMTQEGDTDTDTLRSRLQDAMWTRANFNIVIVGKPLIHHIIDRRDVPTLLLLISGARDQEKFIKNGDTDAQGRTALDYARAIGWKEGAHYLKLYGHTDISDGDTRANNFQTQIDKVLAQAAEYNDAVIVRAALELGANPNVKTRHDLSAFHHCILLLHAETVQLLAEYGADINARHFRGETSLQMLWWCHHPRRLSDDWYQMADRLRALGCDPRDFKTPREMTAQELTREITGAYKGARAMDYALQARDFATYRSAFALLGDGKAQELLNANSVLQEAPVKYLCRGAQLHQVMLPELWYGQGYALRQVWAVAQQELARDQPTRQWRNTESQNFTADDFSRVLGAVDRHALAARANGQFKLQPKGRP